MPTIREPWPSRSSPYAPFRLCHDSLTRQSAYFGYQLRRPKPAGEPIQGSGRHFRESRLSHKRGAILRVTPYCTVNDVVALTDKPLLVAVAPTRYIPGESFLLSL